MSFVLPKYEEHFSVLELSRSLAQFKNVTVNNSEGLHGFMNKLSCNYNRVEYDKYVFKLRQCST
jgi:hypothetical protein